MISQTYNHKKRQQGVSLMLAVLVLSALIAITFSMVTIVLVELRASGDILRTEPALYATLGVTEEAMFQYKRYVNQNQDGTETSGANRFDVVEYCNGVVKDDDNICNIEGVNLSTPDINGDTQPLDYDVVPKIVAILPNQTLKVPLYEKDNYDVIYGLINLQLVPNGNDGDLGVTMKMYLEKNGNPDGDPVNVSDGYLTEGETINLINSMAVTTGVQYEAIFTNSTPDSFLLSITSSTDAAGNNPLGLPFVGKRVLKVVADYLGLTRTYTVTIPVP